MKPRYETKVFVGMKRVIFHTFKQKRSPIGGLGEHIGGSAVPVGIAASELTIFVFNSGPGPRNPARSAGNGGPDPPDLIERS